MLVSKHPETRDAAAHAEATRDPIFLFQVRRWKWLGAPDGYCFDEEGDCVPADDVTGEPSGAGFPLTGEGVRGMTFGEWDTERVYLSRAEAETYGHARHYNYPDGWRVYCVCAEGVLGDLLKAHGEAFWPTERYARGDERPVRVGT